MVGSSLEVRGGGSWNFVHSSGGRSAIEVVEARWLAVAWGEVATMIDKGGR